jgi:hypothetical protein
METGFRTTSDTNSFVTFSRLMSISKLKYKSFELNQERHYTQQYTSKQFKSTIQILRILIYDVYQRTPIST